MFRLQNGLLPSYFPPLFNLYKTIHSYPTRQTDTIPFKKSENRVGSQIH